MVAQMHIGQSKTKEHKIFVGNPALTSMPVPPMCEAQKN
jgi:hypothetical protein